MYSQQSQVRTTYDEALAMLQGWINQQRALRAAGKALVAEIKLSREAIAQRRPPPSSADAISHRLKNLFEQQADLKFRLMNYSMGPGSFKKIGKWLKAQGTPLPTTVWWQFRHVKIDVGKEEHILYKVQRMFERTYEIRGGITGSPEEDLQTEELYINPYIPGRFPSPQPRQKRSSSPAERGRRSGTSATSTSS